jgi:hypothetical protein
MPPDEERRTEIAKLVEFTEGDAYEEIYRAATPEVAEQLRLKTARFGAARARVMGSITATLFNAVVGLGLEEPATEQVLDDIVSFYEPYGVKFMVQVSPFAQPADLPRRLEARGFNFKDEWVKMYRGVDPPLVLTTGLEIRLVGPDQAQAFADTAMKGFELPPSLHALGTLIAAGIGRPGWRHYLAYDGQVPVATGGLYVKDGVGWCGYGSTLPAYRRRGAQSAMFARRITDAGDGQETEMACNWLVTETDTETTDRPSPSYRNMVHAGFKMAYDRPNYVWSSSE